MRYFAYIFFITIWLFFGGCGGQQTIKTGIDFDETLVSKIVNGKTTEEDLIKMFGQPYVKTVVSADETKWAYVVITSTVNGMFSINAESEQKTLEILLKNGVVINHVYNLGKMPTTSK